MEFSSWMEFFLENPHKPFQKCAIVPASDSFRMVGKRPFSSWGMQTRLLPSLDPEARTLGQLKWRVTHLLITICQFHRVLLTTLRGRDQDSHHLRRKLRLGDAKWLAQGHTAESGMSEAHLLRAGPSTAPVPTPRFRITERAGQACRPRMSLPAQSHLTKPGLALCLPLSE